MSANEERQQDKIWHLANGDLKDEGGQEIGQDTIDFLNTLHYRETVRRFRVNERLEQTDRVRCQIFEIAFRNNPKLATQNVGNSHPPLGFLRNICLIKFPRTVQKILESKLMTLNVPIIIAVANFILLKNLYIYTRHAGMDLIYPWLSRHYRKNIVVMVGASIGLAQQGLIDLAITVSLATLPIFSLVSMARGLFPSHKAKIVSFIQSSWETLLAIFQKVSSHLPDALEKFCSIQVGYVSLAQKEIRRRAAEIVDKNEQEQYGKVKAKALGLWMESWKPQAQEVS